MVLLRQWRMHKMCFPDVPKLENVNNIWAAILFSVKYSGAKKCTVECLATGYSEDFLNDNLYSFLQ